MQENDNNNTTLYTPTFPEEKVNLVDPSEAYLPNPSTKKRWYVKFAAYMIILTFISGTTFGLGYAVGINLSPDRENQTNNTGFQPTNLEDPSAINITQLQPVVTTTGSTSPIATIASEVGPSIVTIASYSDQTPGGILDDLNGFYGGTGSGIAFEIKDNQLLIATNYHVIEGATKLEVIFQDGSTIDAVPLGYDSRMDVAVLALDLDVVTSKIDNIVLASFGNSDNVVIGELAVAIGNPLGPEYASTVTSGIISALGRDIFIDQSTSQVNLIQTDAAINPGNSGGALLNAKGEVIGINSAKYVDESVEGIGFAIPINDAISVIDSILLNPSLADLAYELSDDRAFLGVQISDITTEIYNETGMRNGVYITGVFPHSGAEDAGIIEGDIIYSVNDQRVQNIQSLFNVLDSAVVDDIIEVGILRNDDIITVDVKLYSYKDVMDQQEATN